MSADLIEQLRRALGDAYSIDRELGGGGMSRVFLAEEHAFGRKVVVKVLPAEIGGQISVDRLRREISIAGRMQHAHIVPVLSAGEVDGLPWFTMPFVDGESLRLRLTGQAELPLNEAVRVLREIASALAYAHAHGVVHRDIKPENVLLARGAAMVSDFGIAKALSASTTADSDLTSPGVALGTPAYMSPEQASADPRVDHRADIYAWGIVAYELLTGQPPFAGRPAQALFLAHISETPEEISKRRGIIPPGLASLVMRSLEKRPADRPQSADELLLALDALAIPTGAVPAIAFRDRSVKRRWMSIGASALLISGLAAVVVIRGAPARIVVESDVPLATAAALELDAAISPDGRKVAYASGPDTAGRIFVRQVGGDRSIVVSGEEGGSHRWPRWSPSGDRIAFMSRGAIYVVPEIGGPAQRVVKRGTFPAWSPDGNEIAYVDSGAIWIGRVKSGDTRRLSLPGPALDAAGNSLAAALAWSPDGKNIAYALGAQFLIGRNFDLAPASLWVIPARGGKPSLITDRVHLSTSPAWFPDSRSLAFVSNLNGPREVFQQRVHSDGTADGSPTRLGSGLNAHSITLSADGTRLAYSTLVLKANIWSAPINATRPTPFSAARPVTNQAESVETLSISPDGKWLLYDSNRNGNVDIYKVALDSSGIAGDPIQLTNDPADDFSPTASPDGREIAFYSTRFGTRDILVMRADGGGVERVTDLPGNEYHPTWSPDGSRLVYDHSTNLCCAVYESVHAPDGHWGPPNPLWPQRPGLDSARRGLSSPRFTRDGRSIITSANSVLETTLLTSGETRMLFGSDTAIGRLLPIFDLDPRTGAVLIHVLQSNGLDSFWSVSKSGGKPRLVLRLDDPTKRTRRSEFAFDGKRLYFTIASDEADIRVLTLKR